MPPPFQPAFRQGIKIHLQLYLKTPDLSTFSSFPNAKKNMNSVNQFRQSHTCGIILKNKKTWSPKAPQTISRCDPARFLQPDPPTLFELLQCVAGFRVIHCSNELGCFVYSLTPSRFLPFPLPPADRCRTRRVPLSRWQSTRDWWHPCQAAHCRSGKRSKLAIYRCTGQESVYHRGGSCGQDQLQSKLPSPMQALLCILCMKQNSQKRLHR